MLSFLLHGVLFLCPSYTPSNGHIILLIKPILNSKLSYLCLARACRSCFATSYAHSGAHHRLSGRVVRDEARAAQAGQVRGVCGGVGPIRAAGAAGPFVCRRAVGGVCSTCSPVRSLGLRVGGEFGGHLAQFEGRRERRCFS